MPTLLRIVTTLAWSLWFGGIIGLFLSVTTLFKTDHELAISAAPALFHAFEKYQLILATLALLAAFAWRMVFPSGRVVSIFLMLGVAATGAAFETTRVTPRVDELRVLGQTHTPAFRREHGLSMIVYCGEAAILLATGLVLSTTPSQRAKPPEG